MSHGRRATYNSFPSRDLKNAPTKTKSVTRASAGDNRLLRRKSETPSRLEQKIKRNANFVNYHRGNPVEEKCVEKLKCLVSGTSLPIKLRSNSFLDQSQADVANAVKNMRRNSVPTHVRKQLSRESNQKPLHTNSQSRDYYSKTKLRQKSLPYSGFPWHLDDSEQWLDVTFNSPTKPALDLSALFNNRKDEKNMERKQKTSHSKTRSSSNMGFLMDSLRSRSEMCHTESRPPLIKHSASMYSKDSWTGIIESDPTREEKVSVWLQNSQTLSKNARYDLRNAWTNMI